MLITKHLHYDFDSTENPSNDHLLFSKRHASPLLYSIFRAAGLLEGHPTPVLPWVEEATASWARACGLGWAWRLPESGLTAPLSNLGDERRIDVGGVRARRAGHAGLDNLTAIIDVNRLGQRGGDHARLGPRPLRPAGRHAIAIDGHDVDAIDAAYPRNCSRAPGSTRPA